MDKNINWLEPWDELFVKPSSFEKELNSEIGKKHILYQKKVTAIGRRYDCDDILFQVQDSEFSFAVVHLTYSKAKERDSDYPRTILYKDLNDWINRCMIPNHSEFILGEEE